MVRSDGLKTIFAEPRHAKPLEEGTVPKVLVSDSLASEGLRIFEDAAGFELVNSPGLSVEELLEHVSDVDGLVIRSATQVTAEVIEAAPKLRIIGRAGIGLDNVDIDAATARGIVVVNTPKGNNITTAEHALALLVSLARHIPQATASMKAGRWDKKSFQGLELYNRTLGVLGLGNIGRVVADRARGLGMRVLAYDPFIPVEVAQKQGLELAELSEVLSRADAITVHVPRTKETVGLLNASAFEKMKDGVLIINAARGGIIDEQALLNALESGRVGGAGLDVFEEEPPGLDDPLVMNEKVICTPHLGASTEQAQINVAIAVAEQVRDHLSEGVVRNAVNLPSLSPEMLEQLRPSILLAEKLGSFQGQLAGSPVEDVEIEYAGEVSEYDVTAMTLAVLKGLLASTSEGVNLVNAPVIASDRGIKVIESKTSRSQDFASVITTRVRTRGGMHLIAGAIFHGVQPRIVRIDDVMLEAIPEGPTIFLKNRDEPGVVGTIGSVLGQDGVNISRMQLGLIPERSEAAMLVNVHPAPSDAALNHLRSLSAVIEARLVDLG